MVETGGTSSDNLIQFLCSESAVTELSSTKACQFISTRDHKLQAIHSSPCPPFQLKKEKKNILLSLNGTSFFHPKIHCLLIKPGSFAKVER